MQSEVKSTFAPFPAPFTGQIGQSVWFGLYNPSGATCEDADCDGQGLHWSDGSEFTYAAWMTNVKFNDGLDCIRLRDLGKSKELTCANNRAYLCQVTCENQGMHITT